MLHKTLSTFAAAHPEYVFFELDARNAYNEQSRATAVEQASADLPALTGLWNLCYNRAEAHSRYLFRREGKVFWIMSDKGVNQGGGLAPALFAFGMKPGGRRQPSSGAQGSSSCQSTRRGRSRDQRCARNRCFKVQHSLTKARAAALRQELLRSSRDPARVRSCGGPAQAPAYPARQSRVPALSCWMALFAMFARGVWVRPQQRPDRSARS